MIGPYRKSVAEMFGATPNVIGSPALAGGRSHSEKLVGATAAKYGRALVRAKASPSVVNDSPSTIPDTSGQSGSDLSPSAKLQQSLENRLRDTLRGSTSCEVIWRPWTTPWGQCLSKPRARARTISGIDIGLWGTIRVGNGMTGSPARGADKRGRVEDQMAGTAFAMGLWPTATASDHKSRSASPDTLARNARPLREVIFALWSTIRSSDGAKGGPNQSFGAGGSPLPSQIYAIANTSNAPMENGGGSLHPEFAGWEMAYRPEFLACRPLATASTRAPRRRS